MVSTDCRRVVEDAPFADRDAMASVSSRSVLRRIAALRPEGCLPASISAATDVLRHRDVGKGVGVGIGIGIGIVRDVWVDDMVRVTWWGALHSPTLRVARVLCLTPGTSNVDRT